MDPYGVSLEIAVMAADGGAGGESAGGSSGSSSSGGEGEGSSSGSGAAGAGAASGTAGQVNAAIGGIALLAITSAYALI